MSERETPETERLLAALADAKQYNSRLVNQRDQLFARNEQLEATHMLWSRTTARAHLPGLGLTCDATGCAEAIGLVGIQIKDSSKALDAIVELARNLGWFIGAKAVDDDTVSPIESVRPVHYCPGCKDKESK